MTFDQFCSAAWSDHGTDAAGVYRRLPEGVDMVEEPAQLPKLAGLIVHVAGEHLGRWTEGIGLLDRLAVSPHFVASSPPAQAVKRAQSTLLRCAGDHEGAARAFAESRIGSDAPEASDRIRVLAVAAAAFVGQGRPEEARADFDECVRLSAYGPTTADPAARALAVAANNVAAELEDRPTLSDSERALMVRAAAIARQFWGIAGGWMETERAEYRLAMSHLKAGDTSGAQRHAAECLRIVEANGSDPGEAAFAREAISRASLASGDIAGAQRERDAIAAILPAIEDEGFRSFVGAELAKLTAAIATH